MRADTNTIFLSGRFACSNKFLYARVFHTRLRGNLCERENLPNGIIPKNNGKLYTVYRHPRGGKCDVANAPILMRLRGQF